MGMLATRTERPEALQRVAAVGVADRLAARADDGGDQRDRRLAVDFLQRLLREMAEQPAMGVGDAGDPGGRAAAFRQRGNDIHMRTHRHFPAAGAARLDDLQQALFFHQPDGFVRHAAQIVGLGRVLLDRNRDTPGAGDDLVMGRHRCRWLRIECGDRHVALLEVRWGNPTGNRWVLTRKLPFVQPKVQS